MAIVSERSPSRRERKKRQTRQALHQAAVALVAERGLDHVTVEDIADAVDVSRRTFFNYFASKEEALVGQDPSLPDRLRAVVASRPSDEAPLQVLSAVLSEVLGELATDRAADTRQRELLRSEPRLLAAQLTAWVGMERALVHAIAERTDTDPERDLYPAILVGATIGAARAALARWRGGSDMPVSELLDSAFEALARGLPDPRA